MRTGAARLVSARSASVPEEAGEGAGAVPHPPSDFAAVIEIEEGMTLSDVRALLLEELAEEQLPEGVKDGTTPFYFEDASSGMP